MVLFWRECRPRVIHSQKDTRMFNLTIIRPDGQEVEQAFGGDQTVVGRHEKSDLRLLDSMVSRHHCLILREGKRFVLKDLESPERYMGERPTDQESAAR